MPRDPPSADTPLLPNGEVGRRSTDGRRESRGHAAATHDRGVDSVAGLSLSRRLAEGERATVWHALSTSGGVYAVKLFRRDIDRDSVDGELDALARAQGPHVVKLVDVSADSRGAVALVLERLRPAPLAALIAERGPLRIGEAITVLAPLAEAVARLHALGLAHGRLDAGSVLFDARGAPYLSSFGGAAVLATGREPVPEARLALVPEVIADARALHRLAVALVPPGRGGDWLASDEVPPERFASVLAERVFELGRPTAVSFDAPPVELGAAEAVRAEAQPPPATTVPPTPAWLDAAPLPRALLDAVRAATDSVTRLRERLPSPRSSAVRPRAWLLLGAAAALLAGAALLPRAPATDAVEPAAPVPTAASPVALGDAVTGDDPVAAAALLLEARDRCMRELSVLCLETVHQPGGPLAAADAATVRALQEGTPVDVPMPSGLVLVERLGDTAILEGSVADGAAASVVLSRGESGWRLRELRIGE